MWTILPRRIQISQEYKLEAKVDLYAIGNYPMLPKTKLKIQGATPKPSGRRFLTSYRNISWEPLQEGDNLESSHGDE
jgi:hypothetical protein